MESSLFQPLFQSCALLLRRPFGRGTAFFSTHGSKRPIFISADGCFLSGPAAAITLSFWLSAGRLTASNGRERSFSRGWKKVVGGYGRPEKRPDSIDHLKRLRPPPRLERRPGKVSRLLTRRPVCGDRRRSSAGPPLSPASAYHRLRWTPS